MLRVHHDTDYLSLTLLELQSRFGDTLLKFQVVRPQLPPKRDCGPKMVSAWHPSYLSEVLHQAASSSSRCCGGVAPVYAKSFKLSRSMVYSLAKVYRNALITATVHRQTRVYTFIHTPVYIYGRRPVKATTRVKICRSTYISSEQNVSQPPPGKT